MIPSLLEALSIDLPECRVKPNDRALAEHDVHYYPRRIDCRAPVKPKRLTTPSDVDSIRYIVPRMSDILPQFSSFPVTLLDDVNIRTLPTKIKVHNSLKLGSPAVELSSLPGIRLGKIGPFDLCCYIINDDLGKTLTADQTKDIIHATDHIYKSYLLLEGDHLPHLRPPVLERCPLIGPTSMGAPVDPVKFKPYMKRIEDCLRFMYGCVFYVLSYVGTKHFLPLDLASRTLPQWIPRIATAQGICLVDVACTVHAYDENDSPLHLFPTLDLVRRLAYNLNRDMGYINQFSILGEGHLRAGSTQHPTLDVNPQDTTLSFRIQQSSLVGGQVYATLDQVFIPATKSPFEDLELAELLYELHNDANVLSNPRFVKILNKSLDQLSVHTDYAVRCAKILDHIAIGCRLELMAIVQDGILDDFVVKCLTEHSSQFGFGDIAIINAFSTSDYLKEAFQDGQYLLQYILDTLMESPLEVSDGMIKTAICVQAILKHILVRGRHVGAAADLGYQMTSAGAGFLCLTLDTAGYGIMDQRIHETRLTTLMRHSVGEGKIRKVTSTRLLARLKLLDLLEFVDGTVPERIQQQVKLIATSYYEESVAFRLKQSKSTNKIHKLFSSVDDFQIDTFKQTVADNDLEQLIRLADTQQDPDSIFRTMFVPGENAACFDREPYFLAWKDLKDAGGLLAPVRTYYKAMKELWLNGQFVLATPAGNLFWRKSGSFKTVYDRTPEDHAGIPDNDDFGNIDEIKEEKQAARGDEWGIEEYAVLLAYVKRSKCYLDVDFDMLEKMDMPQFHQETADELRQRYKWLTHQRKDYLKRVQQYRRNNREEIEDEFLNREN